VANAKRFELPKIYKKTPHRFAEFSFKFLSTLHIVSFLGKFLVLDHQPAPAVKRLFQNPTCLYNHFISTIIKRLLFCNSLFFLGFICNFAVLFVLFLSKAIQILATF